MTGFHPYHKEMSNFHTLSTGTANACLDFSPSAPQHRAEGMKGPDYHFSLYIFFFFLECSGRFCGLKCLHGASLSCIWDWLLCKWHTCLNVKIIWESTYWLLLSWRTPGEPTNQICPDVHRVCRTLGRVHLAFFQLRCLQMKILIHRGA